jgi:hypothetical protein
MLRYSLSVSPRAAYGCTLSGVAAAFATVSAGETVSAAEEVAGIEGD